MSFTTISAMTEKTHRMSPPNIVRRDVLTEAITILSFVETIKQNQNTFLVDLNLFFATNYSIIIITYNTCLHYEYWIVLSLSSEVQLSI